MGIEMLGKGAYTDQQARSARLLWEGSFGRLHRHLVRIGSESSCAILGIVFKTACASIVPELAREAPVFSR